MTGELSHSVRLRKLLIVLLLVGSIFIQFASGQTILNEARGTSNFINLDTLTEAPYELCPRLTPLELSTQAPQIDVSELTKPIRLSAKYEAHTTSEIPLVCFGNFRLSVYYYQSSDPGFKEIQGPFTSYMCFKSPTTQRTLYWNIVPASFYEGPGRYDFSIWAFWRDYHTGQDISQCTSGSSNFQLQIKDNKSQQLNKGGEQNLSAQRVKPMIL